MGSTNNIERRLRQHNGDIVGGGKYTAKGRPWILITKTRCVLKDRSAAQKSRQATQAAFCTKIGRKIRFHHTQKLVSK